MTQQTKPWWRSRTIWYNVAISLVAVGNELMPILQVTNGEHTELLRAYLVVALSVGNAILRIVTTKPVTLR